MKMMLDWQNISRQGAHQGIACMHARHRDLLQTMELASQARADHPQMGCRDIYYTLPDQMPRGRDWTERVLLSCGYRVKKPLRSFTEPGTNVCSNLIEGMKVTAPNQVWLTDITFKWSGNRWYFLSFVIDVYSRKIVASHCSKDLTSKSQIDCLSKALKGQSGQDLRGLIIHTDRGVQYTCNEYRTYLKYYRTDTYRTFCMSVPRVVRKYNESKPRRGLPSRLSPDQFVKEHNQGNYSDYTVNIWSKLTSTKMIHVN